MVFLFRCLQNSAKTLPLAFKSVSGELDYVCILRVFCSIALCLPFLVELQLNKCLFVSVLLIYRMFAISPVRCLLEVKNVLGSMLNEVS